MQDRPTAQELVEAVREFLERDVMAAVTGRVSFHTRVAVNVLNMVARELEMGAAQDTEQRSRLVALLGEAETTRDLEVRLAAAIRHDALTATQHSEAVAHIKASVKEKLEVANPKYLTQ